MRIKNKPSLLLMALSGLCSTVQAMKSKGQKVIQSHCFKEVLDFLPFKDQIKIQGLNKKSYKNMEKYIKFFPLTYKFTVNGSFNNKGQFVEANGGREMEKLDEMGEILKSVHPLRLSRLRLSVSFVTTFPVEDLDGHGPLEYLHLDNIKLDSNNVELDDLLLKELKLTNCSYLPYVDKKRERDSQDTLYTDEEKVFLRIGDDPTLEKIVVTEDPNEQRTMQVSIFGHCPNLKSVELATKHAQETLEPFSPYVRKDLLCEEGGTVHPKCIVYTDVID